jgi:hypothetical protein
VVWWYGDVEDDVRSQSFEGRSRRLRVLAPMRHVRRLWAPALARQKYWEIRTDFTTLLLYNYKLK